MRPDDPVLSPVPSAAAVPGSLFAPLSGGEEPAWGDLPTCPAPAQDNSGLPAPGQRLGDFELLAELGRGAFGRVFLARQGSLNREVALKVSANQGGEARALARLEHASIVRVYDETVDWERHLRLVWMQYVPGTSLEQVIRRLAGQAPPLRNGRAILEAVAGLSPRPALPDLAELRNLCRLEDSDYVEAVCWLGARLAEALAHAHGRGVLHRDVKPANILVGPSGWPLLADFNLAVQLHPIDGPGAEPVGGSLAYMAPEHLDAFAGVAPPEAIDARSDIYSLGVVLFELLTGTHPFPEPPRRDVPPAEALAHLADVRRRRVPSVREIEPDVPPLLDRIVRRCLDPDPRSRYGSAAELASALDQCREWRGIVQEVPAGLLTRWLLRWPLLVSLILPVLPHLVGGAIDTAYLLLWAASQQDRPGYWNTLAWLLPSCIVVVTVLTTPLNWLLLAPALRARRQLRATDSPTAEDLDRSRRGALGYPVAALGLSVLGWLIGAVVVPPVIHWRAGPLTGSVALHLLWSFLIAGLTALAYCVLAAQFLVLRLAYPALWPEGRPVRPTARVELRGARLRLAVMPMVAVLVPLAAVAAVVVPPDNAPTSPLFRCLIVTLIGVGGTGSVLAGVLAGFLRRLVAAWTGVEPAAAGRPWRPVGVRHSRPETSSGGQ
jgi:serine/threonine protein kinase